MRAPHEYRHTQASGDRKVYKSNGGRYGTSNTIQTKAVTTSLCSFGVYFVGFCGSQQVQLPTHTRVKRNMFVFFFNSQFIYFLFLDKKQIYPMPTASRSKDMVWVNTERQSQRRKIVKLSSARAPVCLCVSVRVCCLSMRYESDAIVWTA